MRRVSWPSWSARIRGRVQLRSYFFSKLGKAARWWAERQRRRAFETGITSSVHGITVVVHRSDAAHTDQCLGKVRAALDLLAEHAPDRVAHMRESFASVFVWYGLVAAVGQYRHSSRMCELYCDYVDRESTTPADIALTLVHEATHARLLSRGGGQRMRRAQAEWLCISAELAVARRLPDADDLVADAKRRLERPFTEYAPSAELARDLADLEARAPHPWLAAITRYIAHRRVRSRS